MLKFLMFVLAGLIQAQQDNGQPSSRQIRLNQNAAVKGNQEPETRQNSPQPLKQNSVSVGLFKNGYAFYVREYEVENDGTFLLDIPSTVQGTLSVYSPNRNVSVSTQYELVNVEAPLDASSLSRSNLQKSFTGKQVTLQLKDSTTATYSTVTGTIAKLAEPVTAPSSPSSSSYPYSSDSAAFIAPSDFLVLEDEQGGLTLVDPNSVVSFKVQGGSRPTRQDKRFTATVRGINNANSAILVVSYLSFGLTWAPSYYINISDSSRLALSFQAQIRNQGPAINADDAQLITGFPNLQYQSVTSLLSSDLNTFIREVNNVGDGRSSPSPSIMSQSIMSNSAYGMVDDVQNNPVSSDGSDVLYQSIGPLKLGAKAAVLKNIATATVSYQQVVDWDASKPEAWDAVRFLNPLSVAITTAPVSVVQNNRLLGQSTTSWTAPNGLASIKTSKALSVRVWMSENQGEEQILQPARAKLSQINVEGVLNVVNSRNTNITMCVNYGFDGVLVPVRGGTAPKVSTIEGGSGLNPRTNVNWEFTMRPNTRTNVTFYYTYKKRSYY